MRFRNLCLIVFFACSSAIFAQKQVKEASYETLKKAFFDNEGNKLTQLKYAKAFLNKAKRENNNDKIVSGYYYYSLLNEGNSAIVYLDSVIKYSINTNNEHFPNSAYCEKASLLEKQFKYKEALQNYLLAEKYALSKKRLDDYYVARFFIATTKSENLGEVREALKIYKEIFNYYRNSEVKKLTYSTIIYQKSIFGIADTYKALKLTDSATYYNKIGYNQARITNNEQMLYLFTLNEGANQVLKKNYNQALDSIQKALPFVKKYNDKANRMASYFYLGKINEGLSNTNEALKNYIKVDSIYTTDKVMYPELIEGYHFLIAHYKKIGDKEKQLKYVTNYISIDSSFQKNHNIMYKLFVKEYDVPHLFKEKEALIRSLKKYNSGYSFAIIGLITIALGLLYNQYRVKKIYKERFQNIINNSQEKRVDDNTFIENDKPLNTDINDVREKENTRKETNIPKEVEERILKSLIHFEKKKIYLKQGITLQSLAKELNTNTVYLSKIINQNKEKKFSDYLNDLRIDQCVIELQKKPQLLKYTIEAISVEFGFNNEDTFSIAFQKRMKLKPSFFISELKKIIENQEITQNLPLN